MRFSALAPTLALLGLAAPTIVSAAEDEIVHVVGKRPEGMITVPGEAIGQEEGQTYALVSELFYGGINSVNLATGDVAQVVPSAGFKERGTLGMWYDSDTGIIFAAGGGATFGTPAKMYAFDALTGDVVADCSPSYDNPSALFNDVAVVDGTAYFTDSFTTTITKMDVAAAKNGDCALSYIALPNDLCGESFCLNGILPYDSMGLNGLLLAHTEEESLYFLDPSDESLTQVIEPGSTGGGDGLVFDDDGHLYIGEFNGSKISVWSLSAPDDSSGGKLIQAELVRTLTSASFDNTANVAISGDNVYTVCVRASIPFGDDAFETYQEAFNVIGLNRNGDVPEGVDQAEEAPIIDPDNSEPEGEKEAGEGQSAEVDAVAGEESAGAYYSYPMTFLAVVLASLFVAIA